MNKSVDIPKKNYVICFFLFLIVIVASLIIYVINNDQKKYSNKVPVLRGKVLELNVDAIDEYLNENDDVLLYLGVANDSNSRTLEEKMLPLIEDGKLNIIYLNITDVNNKRNFIKSFNKKYGSNLILKKYPALIYIKEEKIYEMIQRDDKELTIMDVKQFMKNLGDSDD